METTPTTENTSVFNFSNFENNQHIRAIQREDAQIWFVAQDLCRCLGITNSRDAVAELEEDEKASVVITDTSSSSRKTITMSCVNESGMYALAFKSRKPAAKKFRKWVTSEVLPSIRQTGAYSLEPTFEDAHAYFLKLVREQIEVGVSPDQATKAALLLCNDMIQHVQKKPAANEIGIHDHLIADIVSAMTPGKLYKVQDIYNALPRDHELVTGPSRRANECRIGIMLNKAVRLDKLHARRGRFNLYIRPAA